jgi:hypothetical protein
VLKFRCCAKELAERRLVKFNEVALFDAKSRLNYDSFSKTKNAHSHHLHIIIFSHSSMQ